MTNEPDARGVFNPFVLWTDLGMRAAEMTVASLQNLTEGADRLTRAGASAEVEETEDTDPGSDGRASPLLSADLGGIVGMQRLMWDLMARNWLNWTSAVGNLMSAGAGVGLARKVAGQENPLQAVRDSMQPLAWAERPAAKREAGSTGGRTERRKARGSTEDAQHALAANESKPRRRAAAKSRRTQRSSRK